MNLSFPMPCAKGGEIHNEKLLHNFVAPQLNSFYPNQQDFSRVNCQVKRVKVTDFVGAPPIEDIEEAVDFIDSVLKSKNGVVYVHCKAGRSRSSMMLAAYFIRERKMTAEVAYNFLKSKRSHVDFHELHWSTLDNYTRFLKNKKVDE